MRRGSPPPATSPPPSADELVAGGADLEEIRATPPAEIELLLAELGAGRVILGGQFSPAQARRAQEAWALVRPFIVPTLRDVVTEAFKA